MYKRYRSFRVCRFQGCTGSVMKNSDYCYVHFDLMTK
jgi:hypothetical protein